MTETDDTIIHAIEGATGWTFDRVDAYSRLRFRCGPGSAVVFTGEQAKRFVSDAATYPKKETRYVRRKPTSV